MIKNMDSPKLQSIVRFYITDVFLYCFSVVRFGLHSALTHTYPYTSSVESSPALWYINSSLKCHRNDWRAWYRSVHLTWTIDNCAHHYFLAILYSRTLIFTDNTNFSRGIYTLYNRLSAHKVRLRKRIISRFGDFLGNFLLIIYLS